MPTGAPVASSKKEAETSSVSQLPEAAQVRDRDVRPEIGGVLQAVQRLSEDPRLPGGVQGREAEPRRRAVGEAREDTGRQASRAVPERGLERPGDGLARRERGSPEFAEGLDDVREDACGPSGEIDRENVGPGRGLESQDDVPVGVEVGDGDFREEVPRRVAGADLDGDREDLPGHERRPGRERGPELDGVRRNEDRPAPGPGHGAIPLAARREELAASVRRRVNRPRGRRHGRVGTPGRHRHRRSGRVRGGPGVGGGRCQRRRRPVRQGGHGAGEDVRPVRRRERDGPPGDRDARPVRDRPHLRKRRPRPRRGAEADEPVPPAVHAPELRPCFVEGQERPERRAGPPAREDPFRREREEDASLRPEPEPSRRIEPIGRLHDTGNRPGRQGAPCQARYQVPPYDPGRSILRVEPQGPGEKRDLRPRRGPRRGIEDVDERPLLCRQRDEDGDLPRPGVSPDGDREEGPGRAVELPLHESARRRETLDDRFPAPGRVVVLRGGKPERPVRTGLAVPGRSLDPGCRVERHSIRRPRREGLRRDQEQGRRRDGRESGDSHGTSVTEIT